MAKPQLSTSSGYSSNSKPVKVRDLFVLMKSRVEEAEILLANGKYDAANYLCGYAVELALKIRICRNFRWSEYPPLPSLPPSSPLSGEDKCYEDVYKSLTKDFVMIHDLKKLLCLSGITLEDIVTSGLDPQWKEVAKWNPENRYKKIQSVDKQSAEKMIEVVKELLKMFLGIYV